MFSQKYLKKLEEKEHKEVSHIQFLSDLFNEDLNDKNWSLQELLDTEEQRFGLLEKYIFLMWNYHHKIQEDGHLKYTQSDFSKYHKELMELHFKFSSSINSILDEDVVYTLQEFQELQKNDLDITDMDVIEEYDELDNFFAQIQDEWIKDLEEFCNKEIDKNQTKN